VLLTGGTGLVGKVTIEKLLRCCPDIECLYLLTRDDARKNIPAAERVVTLMQDEVFAKAREANPGCESKVKAVPGDISVDRLGIPEEMRAEVCEKVTVLIHIAATVRFQERLKVAVNLNIKGVKRMIELAHDLKKCVSFTHCSTAYTHTYKETIREQLYDPTFSVDKLMEITELLDVDQCDALTPSLISPHPNTYTFTKCLGEHCVKTELGDIPFSVVRPAIVTAAWKEPFPGWTNNLNGPNGLALMTGAGLCRVVRGKTELSPNLVPIDNVANYLVVAAWFTGTTKESGRVYNCVNAHNQTTWKQFGASIIKFFKQYPLEGKIFRNPKLDVISAEQDGGMLLNFWKFFSHRCYATMGDTFLKLAGKEAFASRAYAKLDGYNSVLSLWLNNEWFFEERNGKHAMSLMNEEDKLTYNIDLKNMHWNSYMENYILGMKKYIVGEVDPKKNKARGQKALKKVIYTDLSVRVILSSIVFKMFSAVGIMKKRSFKMTLLLAMVYAKSSTQFQEWSIIIFNLIYKKEKRSKPLEEVPKD
jgi:fatty acyl-CoA reductase